MAENIVEDVGLLEIIHLLFGADEGSGRKSPVRQMIEEDIVGNELGDRNDAPAGDPFEPIAQPFHVGDAGFGELERVHHRGELVAGAVVQHRL